MHRARTRRTPAWRIAPVLFAGMLAACGALAHTRVPAGPKLPFAADTMRAEVIRPGVTHRYIYAAAGPWAIHALEVDLDQCYTALALKGAAGAAGRAKTSALLAGLHGTAEVVGGVNADFFSLVAPQGVPTGALISRGRVITGPSTQPVLAFDATGMPSIVTLRAAGSVTIGDQRIAVTGWNHAVPGGVALYDTNWGTTTDSASATIEVVLSGRSPARVVQVDTARAGVKIPGDGAVLVAGQNAPAAIRTALLGLRAGEPVQMEVSLAPAQPREAVGGRPLLVRDSVVPGIVDTEGQPGFATGRHPRTAAGIARGGKRLILVVVDGRQAPYSDGMTLRELANLMLALGARDAINLDGGGSTTMLYATRDSARTLRIANHPSDAAGERPVGDALAIVRGCPVR